MPRLLSLQPGNKNGHFNLSRHLAGNLPYKSFDVALLMNSQTHFVRIKVNG
jgi:hypothetical protein